MEPLWQSYLPDSLLLEIFTYLDFHSLCRASRVCRSWYRVANDELLWQGLARSIWKIKGPLSPGKTNWRSEVERLSCHVPCVCCETIQRHSDEVLDVHMSHDGQYFSTCSKDALVVLWRLGFGSKSQEVRSFNTEKYLRWQLTQYSVFSPDDALLLVCGVKRYDEVSDDYDGYRAGAAAVLTIPDLHLVCFVEMDPPTMFGAWLNERTFLSGWTGIRPNTAEIRAYQLTEEKLTKPLLINSPQDSEPFVDSIGYERFGKKLLCLPGDRYHLMNLLVANVRLPSPVHRRMSKTDKDHMSEGEADRLGRKRTPDYNSSSEVPEIRKLFKVKDNGTSCISEPQLPEGSLNVCDTSLAKEKLCTSCCHGDSEGQLEGHSLKVSFVKQCVAFVTGNHDVVAVSGLSDRHYDILDKKEVVNCDRVEAVDHLFHIKDCYITGLCTSHNQRYLYFNFRELDKKATAEVLREYGIVQLNENQELEIPVSDRIFCRELRIGCIDLVAMERVKVMEYEGHIGYSAFPAWYICLDASPDYVGSGSEDMRGYIWDRHYRVKVSRLFHSPYDTGENTKEVIERYSSSVVNGIAFSPVDQETCITVCDDNLIKVWRSKNHMKT